MEDEKLIADSLRAGLSENGYEASVAYNGEKALELFFQEHFDLLLLDINLEETDGFEVCKEIRLKNTSVGIIMLTSMYELTDKVNGYSAGADDYIVKPVEFRELMLKIRAVLKRTLKDSNADVAVLRSSNLEMNLDKKEVRRNNYKINLTVREFHLLEFLLRNKNKVVSRADIAMHVWGIDFNTNTNVIDVYISYLRNKIDRDFQPKLIHTHVGMGFILKENGN